MASFAKRRTRRVVLGRLALLAFSIVLMVGLSECAIRLALPPSTFRDHDSDAFWILRLREVTPMERMHADETLFDAALGWRAKPGFVRGNVHQNSRGVRGAREHDAFAGAGTRRMFEGSADTLYVGTHWNAEGHALAATALAQALVTNELRAVK